MSGEAYHLDSLRNNTVYFSSVEELNDPYEGLMYYCDKGITHSQRMAALTQKLNLDHKNVKRARKEAEAMYKKMGAKKFSQHIDSVCKSEFEDFVVYHREHRFVLSLARAYTQDDNFPAPLNDMMMWGHYGNGMKGMCIEYDFEKLRTSINKLNDVKLTSKAITYSEVNLPVVKATTLLDDMAMRNDGTSFAIQDAFCTKNSSWKYENEVRLISPLHKLNFIDEAAISRVFVSAINKKLMTDVKGILASKSHRPDLYEVATHEREYQFGFRKVEY